MFKIKLAMASSMVALLAACGGGSDPAAVYGENGVEIPDSAGVGAQGLLDDEGAAELAVAFNALIDGINDNTFQEANIPTGGQINTRGFIALNVEDDENTIIGNLDMNVNLGNSTISGSAGDFAEFEGSDDDPVRVSQWTGELFIDGHSIVGAGSEFSASFQEGTLTRDDEGADNDGDQLTLNLDFESTMFDVNGDNLFLGDVFGTGVIQPIDDESTALDMEGNFVTKEVVPLP